MSNGKSWTNQPDCVEGCDILFSTSVKDIVLEVRRAAFGTYYLTAGTLWNSQTILCPNAELVLVVMNAVVNNRKDKPVKLPAACMEVEQ